MTVHTYFTPIKKLAIPLSNPSWKPMPEVEREVLGRLAESLLFSDAVILELNGPATELPAILSWLNYEHFHSLVQSGVIKFVFSPGTPAYITPENSKFLKFMGTGLAFAQGVNSSWREPEEACRSALKALTNLWDSRIRRLSESIAEATQEFDFNETFDHAKKDISALYERGLARAVGLNPQVNPEDGLLDDNQRARYLGLASSQMTLHIAGTMGCQNLVSQESDIVASVLDFRIKMLLERMGHGDTFRPLAQFYDVPDFGYLLQSGRLSFEDIVQYRTNADGIRFRNWLNSVDVVEPRDVVEEYIRANLGKPEKVVVKALKVAVYAGLSMLVSGLNPILSKGIETTASVFDAFLLDKIRNNWKPRMFLDELRFDLAKAGE